MTKLGWVLFGRSNFGKIKKDHLFTIQEVTKNSVSKEDVHENYSQYSKRQIFQSFERKNNKDAKTERSETLKKPDNKCRSSQPNYLCARTDKRRK